MPKITGAEKHLARVRAITAPAAVEKLGQALLVGAQMIQTEAQILLTTGAVSGKNHKPSAPGTPPNNDTGHLAGNIEAYRTGPLAAKTTSEAEYAVIHEFGGVINHPGGTPYFPKGNGELGFVSKNHRLAAILPKTKPHKIVMPERPYMRPAVAKVRNEVVKLVTRTVNLIIRARPGA